MTINITWFGHNAWSIETAGHTLLVDPFLNDSPTAPVKADAVKADFILLSHGHGDHLGDTVAIAKRTSAKVLTNFEVGEWLKKKGLADEQVIGMNPGGGVRQPFGHVKFTIAHHSSSMPDGSYGGVPGGFLLKLDDARVYFACDTALFLDMKLIGAGGLDLAVLPIGDLYTLGPETAAIAAGWLGVRQVVPIHWGTFPALTGTPAELKALLAPHNVEVLELEPGQTAR